MSFPQPRPGALNSPQQPKRHKTDTSQVPFCLPKREDLWSLFLTLHQLIDDILKDYLTLGQTRLSSDKMQVVWFDRVRQK